jgi:hypothetical protein
MKVVNFGVRRFDAQRHLSNLAPRHIAWVADALEPFGFKRDTVLPVLHVIWWLTDRASFERSR